MEDFILPEPIEVELGGKIYRCTKITNEIRKHRPLVEKGTFKDIPVLLAVIFDANLDDLKKLDIRDLARALKFFEKEIQKYGKEMNDWFNQ